MLRRRFDEGQAVDGNTVRMVVSDVDGTLVDAERTLRPTTIAAAAKLHDAGVLLALQSSRPPLGMAMFVAPLGLTAPLVGFNGAMTVTPDQQPLAEVPISAEAASVVLSTLAEASVSIWAFEGSRWLVADRDGPRVQHHAADVRYQPELVDDVAAAVAGLSVTKIVGVSDDHDAVAHAEALLHAACGAQVSATRSQPCYLDVTDARADKGAGLLSLCDLLDVPAEAVLAIGDGANDTAMFSAAGIGVAMGNARPEVRAAADVVTGANTADGWADAINDLVLAPMHT